jgi:hypothetical protein
LNDELSKIAADLERLLRKSVEVVDNFHILTEDEKKAWRETEPDFNKAIVSALPDRRKVTPLRNRREGNSAGIWNIFKLAQFEPEDANSPPYRLYPLTRLANGGELALATEP